MDSALGNCPKCGAVITDEHQHSWCDYCGEPLPSDLAARVPYVQDMRAWAEASTAPSPVPPPQKTRVVIGDIKMRFGSTTVFMFLRRSIAYLIDSFLIFLFVRPVEFTELIVGDLSPLARFGLQLSAIGICWFYIVGSHARWGCTLGKLLCGLQVASLDGSTPPPLKNAFLRAVPIMIVGNLDLVMAMFARRSWRADIFSYGRWHGNLSQTLALLWVVSDIFVALVTGGYRSLHDIIGGTLVTKEGLTNRAKDRRPQQAENRPNLAYLIAYGACLIVFVAFAWLAVVRTEMGGNRTIPEGQQRYEKKSFGEQLQEIQATTHTLDDTPNIFPSFHLPSLPGEETQNDTSLRSSITNSANERLESIYRESGRTPRQIRFHFEAVPGAPQAPFTVTPPPSPPP
jgi:uncharacterized RDD family membrane protein YckC